MTKQQLFLKLLDIHCTAFMVEAQTALYNNWNPTHIDNCVAQGYALPTTFFDSLPNDAPSMVADFVNYLVKQQTPASWIPATVVNR